MAIAWRQLYRHQAMDSREPAGHAVRAHSTNAWGAAADKRDGRNQEGEGEALAGAQEIPQPATLGWAILYFHLIWD